VACIPAIVEANIINQRGHRIPPIQAFFLHHYPLARIPTIAAKVFNSSPVDSRGLTLCRPHQTIWKAHSSGPVVLYLGSTALP
jgi:hypothetical protein